MRFPLLYRIQEITAECADVRSYRLLPRGEAIQPPKPGNFVMLWVPYPAKDSDAVPMSVSDCDGEAVTLTVRRRGSTTSALFDYSEGDLVGLTGPLGSHFSTEGRRVLMVGGGTGIAPLRFLVKEYRRQRPGIRIHMVCGAVTGEELFFRDELERLCDRLWLTTEDGSLGAEGVATDVLEDALAASEPDMIHTCGPRDMMVQVVRAAEERGISCEFSLETLMRCGVGLCGTCSVKGRLVCRDGPVFTTSDVALLR